MAKAADLKIKIPLTSSTDSHSKKENKRKAKTLLSVLSLFFQFTILGCATTPVKAAPHQPQWTWKGFEIIGNEKASRSDILSFIPVKVGEPYAETPDQWHQWCDDLKNGLGFYQTECSAVRYANFDAYFVVEVVERGQEYRTQFRSTPTGDIPFASAEVLDLYERLYKRLWDLFNQGQPAQETTDKGFLDYSDKEMHEIVLQLTQAVPTYRGNLLKVLAEDRDINKREKAANLLNWSITNLDQSVVEANRLLDDPSSLVRNNISRFTLHFIGKVKNKSQRKQIIKNLLVQLDRPSHGDRNKAIYNLLFIAQKFPEDVAFMKKTGLKLIRKIADTSVLDNVRDPAQSLIKMMGESK